jgi:hypothetical protein
MKSISYNSSLLIAFCFCIIVWIAIQSAFFQFLHYDSQYRLLDPDHYNVEVITEEDHKQLSNSENRTVMLSNGTTKIKEDIWDSHVLPKYKSVNNGSQYVLVTLKGTAPFIHQWYSSVLPIFIICIIGLFWGIKSKTVKNRCIK